MAAPNLRWQPTRPPPFWASWNTSVRPWRVEEQRTRHGRSASDDRRIVDDPGRNAQTPGPCRGSVVLPMAARAGSRTPMGHRGLEGRCGLGLALGRPRHPGAVEHDLAGRRRPIPHPGDESVGGRRLGRAGHGNPQFMGTGGTEPAVDRGPHDRGIRAAQRATPISCGNRWMGRRESSVPIVVDLLLGGQFLAALAALASGLAPQPGWFARGPVTDRTNRHPGADHCSRKTWNTCQAPRAGQSPGSNEAGRPGSIRGNNRQASISRR